MATFESAYSEIKKLAETFKAGEPHYLSPSYQEAEVRKDFIDKFWVALGWDVLHEQQKNPYEQEVKVEKGVSVSGAQKRADYSFSLAPNFRDPKFFVEAKKPAQDLFNKDYYFQTIRYAWHKGNPLAVLTDFEAFHIIDCRFSPNIDTALDRRYKHFHYTDYADKEKFGEIYWLFSREAVASHSLEKIAETLPKPKGRASQKTLLSFERLKSIDEEFLEEIEEKRELLAKALKRNNDRLDGEELTEATQKIIDRLVFIRFLEDKLIEHEHYVDKFGEKGSAWNAFIDLCRRLDAKYNGIVFKRSFIDEANFNGPADSEFRSVCQALCHLHSRFLYNEIPIHILGSIYERFLGKTVYATDKRVRIEEKPEVRKAGGVYYTPKYIVDYIVANTIGTLIEGKTPEQIAKLRFADIACGSGSFLIGAFDYLLLYHNKYYQQHPEKAQKDGCKKTPDGLWTLSIRQKKAILLNNIYGVDIDSQAVEVTQLSLSLKILEDETTATANDMQVLFHEKILPDMADNIICGNSLIGTDIQWSNIFISEKEVKAINPMDFESMFPEIMGEGGFDAIIGNPPYVNIENLNKYAKEYFFNRYRTCKGRTDIYIAFMEKSLMLLKDTGRYSFIIPYAFTNQRYGSKLRERLIKAHNIDCIVDTSSYYVFKQAKIKNIIIVIDKEKNTRHKTKIIVYETEDNFINNKKKVFSIKQSAFRSLKDYRLETKPVIQNIGLRDKLWNGALKLSDICFIAYGARLNHKTKPVPKSNYIHDTAKKGWKPFLEGKNIDRYYCSQEGWLDYKPEEHYNAMFPELFENEKLMFINVVKEQLRFAYDENGLYNSHTVVNCIRYDKLIKANHISVKKVLPTIDLARCKKYDYKYLLGVLNSRLINWYFVNFLSEGLHFYPDDAKNIPIKEADKQTQDNISKLVELLIQNKKYLQEAVTKKDKDRYLHMCRGLEWRIDQLVYELYGLSTEEIAIIEKNIEP
jgi:tRNA1(Val) A37 N6-methylase TrmN6